MKALGATRKKMRRLAVVLACVAALGGCSDDPSDVTARDLVGLWAAISMVYTSQADPGTRADLVQDGYLYSIRLHADGRYESSLFHHATPTVMESGTYDVQSRQLLLTPTGEAPRTLELSFNNALLTLKEPDAAWDFDGDGTAEPAVLDMVLDRS